MRNKILLTDVDGVLLNWQNNFVKFMSSHGHEPKFIDESTDVLEWWDIAYYKALEFGKAFQEDEAFSYCEPWPHAVENVLKLVDGGFRVIAVTAVDATPNSKKYRVENLRREFGNIFEEIFLVGFGGDKRPYLQNFSNGFWVEDSFNNAKIGMECGHHAFLMDAVKNRDKNHEKIQRVKDWNEIYDEIQKNV